MGLREINSIYFKQKTTQNLIITGSDLKYNSTLWFGIIHRKCSYFVRGKSVCKVLVVIPLVVDLLDEMFVGGDPSPQRKLLTFS